MTDSRTRLGEVIRVRLDHERRAAVIARARAGDRTVSEQIRHDLDIAAQLHDRAAA